MKEKPSKLDPFAERLDDWFGETGATLESVQAKLALDGCNVSLSRLSDWLQRRQSKKFLGLISETSRLHKEVKSEYASHPAAELETLLNTHRNMLMNLSVTPKCDAKILKVVDQGLRTLMEYQSGLTKSQLEKQKLSIQERRVQLLEKKAAAFDRAKAAVNAGGLTPETLKKIESELKLL